jgi:DNA primase
MDQEILNTAEQLLGRAVKIETHRDWAIFWCPFHGDQARAGQGGHANFGVQLGKGYWKCLRCGISGGSLKSLAARLGQTWQPPETEAHERRPVRKPTQVDCLDEAMSDARARLQHSPAIAYLHSRGVSAYTALVYGLGYGHPLPAVGRQVIRAARQSLLVRRDGRWLWAGSMVYADPPFRPTVINARYLPNNLLPPGTRNFKPSENHKTWGNRLEPLGAWRIKPTTRLLVVVEGLFDMLVMAQAIKERGLDSEVTAVYTNGASPSARMLYWFSQNSQYEYLLVRDPDEAGVQWTAQVGKAINDGGGRLRMATPPGELDPDEAILKGWWPDGL